MGLMHDEKALFDKLLQTAVILCTESIEGDDDPRGEVFVDGTSNILTKSDFADLERLRELLRTIGEKSRLMQILDECIQREAAADGVQVVIGTENRTPSLQNCTLISAPYRVGNSAVGTLSVLGPTRIEYARMISIVSYVARTLEKIMSTDIEKTSRAARSSVYNESQSDTEAEDSLTNSYGSIETATISSRNSKQKKRTCTSLPT